MVVPHHTQYWFLLVMLPGMPNYMPFFAHAQLIIHKMGTFAAKAYFKKNLVQHAITLARNNPKTQVSGFGSVTSLLGLSNLAPSVPLIILPWRHLVRSTYGWFLLFLLLFFLVT